MTPTTFGPYQLVKKLAQGGLGVVWIAYDPKLNRSVALKTLISAGNTRQVQRFLIEAQAAAMLKHPHIVPVHDFGEANGQHYMTMDLVPGESLGDRLSRVDDVDPIEAARLMAPVARALHYAHEQGVLHRDVKPDNVLINERGEPLVTDFGLAKIVDSHEDLTRTGHMLGTLAYMPPEQAKGEKDTDRRADVYGLGATLYHMVTGQPPVVGSAPAVLARVMNGSIDPPSSVRPVPRSIEAVIMMAMRFERSERYATCEALAADLERFARGESVEARPVARAGKRILVALAALAMLVAVGLALAISIDRTTPDAAPPDEPPEVVDAGPKVSTDEEVAALEQLHGVKRIRAAAEWLATYPDDARVEAVRRLLLVAKLGQPPVVLGGVDTREATVQFVSNERALTHNRFGGNWAAARWDVTRRRREGPPLLSRDNWSSRSSQHGRWLLLGGEPHARGNLVIIDTDTREAIERTVGDLRIHRSAVAPDGKLLALGLRGGNILLCEWDDVLRSPTPQTKTLRLHESTIVGLSFTPDGESLLSLSGEEINAYRAVDNRLACWSTYDWTPRWERPMDIQGAFLRLHPDGKRVLVGKNLLYRLTLHDIATGEPVQQLFSPLGEQHPNADIRFGKGQKSAHRYPPRDGVFTPDGSKLFSLAVKREEGFEVRLWDVESGQDLFTLDDHSYHHLALSPDGKTLLFTEQLSDDRSRLVLLDVDAGYGD